MWSQRARWELISLFSVAVVILCTANCVNAIGALRYRNSLEEVTGLEGAPALSLWSSGWRAERSVGIIEAGERSLFGIDGLGASFFRVGVSAGAVGTVVSSVFLSSPVGEERMVRVEPAYGRRGSFVFSAHVDLHSVTFDDYPGSYLVSSGADLLAWLSTEWVVGYGVDAVRLAGIDLSGGETQIFLGAFPDGVVSSFVGFRMAGNGESSLHLSGSVRVGHIGRVAVGYDDGSGSVGGSARIDLSRLAIMVGAFGHPDLGLTKSVFAAYHVGGGE